MVAPHPSAPYTDQSREQIADVCRLELAHIVESSFRRNLQGRQVSVLPFVGGGVGAAVVQEVFVAVRVASSTSVSTKVFTAKETRR